MSFDHDTDELWADGQLAQRLAEVRTGVLRYPGGEETSFFHWELPGAPGYRDVWDLDPESRHHADRAAAERNTRNMDPDEFVAWCRKIGAEPLLGVNIESGVRLGRVEESIAEAARWVRDVREKGYGVRYFYLDNESNHREPLNYKQLSVDEYASHVRAFSQAMKGVDPEIELIANVMGLPSNEAWDELLRLAGPHFDVADVHWYWSWGSADWETWLDTNPMAYYPWEAEQFREKTKELGLDIELAMLEWNVGPNDARTHSPFQQALMQAEMLAQIVEGRYAMACMWPLIWHVEEGRFQSLVDRKSLEPTPTYQLLKLFGNVLGQQLVWSEADRPHVRPVAALSQDRRTLWVYVLHKSRPGQELHATLEVDGFRSTSAEAVAFSAETPDARVAELRPLEVSRQSRRAPYRVALPPHSLTLVTLSR
jgi:hypothetical protein